MLEFAHDAIPNARVCRVFCALTCVYLASIRVRMLQLPVRMGVVSFVRSGY